MANGVQWLSGDNIVTTTMEFPANAYPWLVLEHRGVNVCRVDEEAGRVPFDRLAAAINSRTRLVTVSAVQWSNGFRTGPDPLGRAMQGEGRSAVRGTQSRPSGCIRSTCAA